LDLADYIIEKESNGRQFDKQGNVLVGDKHLKIHAYGIAQFRTSTFSGLKKEAGMPYLDWKNEQDQETLLLWALEHGYCRLWSTCPQKYR
jgi:hypothetical protein